jgi:hypothetical protein
MVSRTKADAARSLGMEQKEKPRSSAFAVTKRELARRSAGSLNSKCAAPRNSKLASLRRRMMSSLSFPSSFTGPLPRAHARLRSSLIRHGNHTILPGPRSGNPLSECACYDIPGLGIGCHHGVAHVGVCGVIGWDVSDRMIDLDA